MMNHIWIKACDEPLRYEYGEASDDRDEPAIQEPLASVQEDRWGRFQWTTYTPPLERGTADDRLQAQKEAQKEVRRRTENLSSC
jgi:hypothetical protein